jgi:hypothetical protein
MLGFYRAALRNEEWAGLIVNRLAQTDRKLEIALALWS